MTKTPYGMVIHAEGIYKSRKRKGLWNAFDKSLRWRLGVVIVHAEEGGFEVGRYEFVESQTVETHSGTVSPAGIEDRGLERQSHSPFGEGGPFPEAALPSWEAALEQAANLPLVKKVGNTLGSLDEVGWPGSCLSRDHVVDEPYSRFADQMDAVYLARKQEKLISKSFFHHARQENAKCQTS